MNPNQVKGKVLLALHDGKDYSKKNLLEKVNEDEGTLNLILGALVWKHPHWLNGNPI
ncbi:hypothetical protein [Olivibacter jilunii]|uniref:hypothetical protein n=1 Tax=Olivibacter jilunii TaxID=985016 RepID=UPI0013EF18B3|nr:hypothetical protein [Olivibacter jilunii]